MSPAITGDELELFVIGRDDGTRILHATRASIDATFTGLTPVLGLSDCTSTSPSNVDVSSDGLRLYVGCGAESSMYVREDRASPFTMPRPLGLGTSFSIGSDELTATDGTVTTDGVALRAYVRSSLTEPFTFDHEVATVATDRFVNATLTADGRTLFASWLNPNATFGVASRADEDSAFGAFAPVFADLDVDLSGDPDLSHDCRAVYFVAGRDSDVTIYEARR